MRALAKASRLALMGFDVDGVMTDGTLYFGPQGDEIKAFSSLDGHGLKLLMAAGIEVIIISGRRSRALELRAENLGVSELHMGVQDKLGTLQSVLALCQTSSPKRRYGSGNAGGLLVLYYLDMVHNVAV